MTNAIEQAVKLIRLENGIQLPYVEQGDSDGVPVVFLHGGTDSWHSFEPLLPFLPSTIRAFSLTQRGHGDADRPASGYSMADFAADVTQFADALNLGPIIVVGHSMGSMVGQKIALDYPDLLSGFVGIGMIVDGAGNAVLQEFQGFVETLDGPIDRAFALEFQASTLAQPIAPELLDLFVDESLKLPARVWKAVFAGIMEADFTGEIGTIAAPALLIWGDRDELAVEREQRQFAEGGPSRRLTIYEGVGHAVHWEEPARVAADIATFVKEVAD
jgi:non-heme chloroperoxidase